MKKFIVLIFILLFIGCATTQQMAKLEQKVTDLEEQVLMGSTERAGASFYPARSLIGGVAGSLDNITSVVEKDVALVALEDDTTFGDAALLYVADNDSGATESVPFVIDPDEAGDIRWKLVKIFARGVGLYATADALADEGYTGIIITGKNAGEGIYQGNLVYWDATETEWMMADANVAGKFPARGVALTTGVNGEPMDVLVQGIMRHDDWAQAFTVGGPVFLSATITDNESVTATAPTTEDDCVQVVGWALTVDEVYFNFSGHWLLVAAP